MFRLDGTGIRLGQDVVVVVDVDVDVDGRRGLGHSSNVEPEDAARDNSATLSFAG